MASKSSNKLTPSKIFLWILMGMLFLGLAGFGATNFGGSFTRVASVGDKDIDVNDYATALQQDIRALGREFRTTLTFQQALAFGVPQQTLARLVTTRAFDHETSQIGLSVGDEALAEQLRQIPNFQDSQGEFDRTAYAFALQNIGQTEAEFEETLREEAARTLLQSAVIAGTAMPAPYSETLVAHALETRDAQFALLPDSALDLVIEDPAEADLRAFYEANIARYTAPETRDITYAWVNPDMLLDSVEVPEDVLRAGYNERIAEFNLPERRLVEQLVFPDTIAAETALARIANGATFEDEVAARGLDLADVDLGDVTVEDLDQAGSAVFAAAVGDIAGPAPTTFGPALFRINAVLPAQSTSFEEARDALRRDLGLDRARRQAATVAEDAANELAAGVTIEELAEITDLSLGQIDWTSGSAGGIADYPAFRSAAAAVTTSDFPDVMDLGDGGIFALRLNTITPPTPIPFEEVGARLRDDWVEDARVTALTAQAEALSAQLGEGATFSALGLDAVTRPGLTRTDFLPDLPDGGVETLFTLAVGGRAVLPAQGGVVILQLDAITPADLAGEDAANLMARLDDDAASGIAQDLFQALAADIQQRAGLSIDQTAIDAVHVNFQ